MLKRNDAKRPIALNYPKLVLILPLWPDLRIDLWLHYEPAKSDLLRRRNVTWTASRDREMQLPISA